MSMNFNYKNLQFNYTYSQGDFIGEGNLIVPREIILELIENYSDFHLDLEEHTSEDIMNFIVHGKDDLINWLEDNFTEDFNTTNADLQILLFKEMIENEEPVELFIEGENPYWILHDLMHAKYDVNGFDIYVNKYVEEERIFQGIELARELNMLQHVNVDLLKQIAQGFIDRWDYKFDINKAINLLNGN